MKRLTLICVLVALVISACEKPIDKKNAIVGTWTCQEINDLIIPTNDMVVLDFDANGNVSYLRGVKSSASASQFSSEQLSYQLEEDNLVLKGSGDNALEMHFTVSYLDEGDMTLLRTYYSEKGTMDSTHKKMKFEKVNATNRYDDKIQGLWTGYQHKSAGKYDSLATIRMNFEMPDQFVFSKKFNSNWSDCNGTYHLYNNVFVVNYATEFSSYYDCWMIKSLNDKEMIIEQYSAMSDSSSNLKILKYRMLK